MARRQRMALTSARRITSAAACFGAVAVLAAQAATARRGLADHPRGLQPAVEAHHPAIW